MARRLMVLSLVLITVTILTAFVNPTTVQADEWISGRPPGVGEEPANLPGPLPDTARIVVNTSGDYLQILHGNSGLPVYCGDYRLGIAPGEAFISYDWGPEHYFYFGGWRFHYIGSLQTSDYFHFFLVVDWTY